MSHQGKRVLRPWTALLFKSLLIIHAAALFPKDPQHCLWELKSRGARIFMAGSIHILGASDYPLAPAIEEAYRKSEVVYFEVAIDSMAMMSVQQKMMMAGMLRNQTLPEVLSDSVYQALSKELLEYNIQISALSGFKPWLVATMLTLAKLNALGFNQQYGLDQYFHKRALEDGKPTGSLESIDDQIRCFTALEGGLEDEMILETLKSADAIESEFFILRNAWKRGLSSVIDSVMNGQMDAYPNLKKTLLDDRNARWTGRVKQMIHDREKALIVVGAGHLVGENSLIDLLRKDGYKIRQR